MTRHHNTGVQMRQNGRPLLTKLLIICTLALGGVGFTTASDRLDQAVAVDHTVEEQRVAGACARLPVLGCAATSSALSAPDDIASATRLGTRLWRRSQHSADAAIVDDRLLYWHRLLAKRDFKKSFTEPAGRSNSAILTAFERASRGFSDLEFRANTALKILITGFDPFGLHNRLDQSNPSGVAALALDGLVIGTQGLQAELQSAVFPVRFADFDEGLVESLLEPLLLAGAIDAVFTLSMGREGFDLERFPGRRRSAEAPDNLMVRTRAHASNPLIPALAGKPIDGPEFVEFTLPAESMVRIQQPYPVQDNRRVRTLARGTFEARSLAELEGEIAVSGSGGGYLSNEISYRTVRLASQQAYLLPAGHIHTPRIKGHDPEASQQITRQIQAMLEAALPALQLAKQKNPR